MAEVDLIPRSWRDRRRARQILVRGAAAVAGLIVALVAARLAIDGLARTEQQAVRALEPQKSELRARGAQARALRERLAEAGRRAEQRARLLGRPLAQTLLLPLDRAFGPQLWLDEIAFSRTITAPAPAPAPAPAAGAAATPDAAHTVRARAELHGKALDHAALARFVNALAAQPEFGEVRLLSTRMQRYTETEVIDFALELVVAPDAGPRS